MGTQNTQEYIQLLKSETNCLFRYFSIHSTELFLEYVIIDILSYLKKAVLG